MNLSSVFGTVQHKDLLNADYRSWIAFLRSSENWGEEAIAEFQFHEMKRIIGLALQTPGYRKMLDAAGMSLDSIRDVHDFRRIPIVTKEILRDAIEDFTLPVRERDYVTTGGSTGMPFGFFRDRVSFAKELASKAYQYYRVGWREGDRQIVFRGLPIETEDHTEYVPEFNELRCSSYYLVPEWLEVYRLRALEFQPAWIKGYPSSIEVFANFLKETARPFPRVRGILCASENLYDHQRILFQQVFNAPVFSHYGHYEMAVLAGFCEHESTYHVLPQYGFAELIDEKGNPVSEPGKRGEIVGTSFISNVTLFLRYRTQDFAVLKGWGCSSCGRPYQIWERIDGRLQEFIVTASGRLISMTAINMHDDVFDHVWQFQFYQKQIGEVVFRYIPKPTCTATIVEDMKKRLLLKLGTDVQLAMQAVDRIPLTKRGKHRFLIQELDVRYGDA
jgi:phenylacetate-CoA ligase